jgi:hypothetical protein
MMLRHHAALAFGKLTRVTSGVNLPPLEVIMSRRQEVVVKLRLILLTIVGCVALSSCDSNYTFVSVAKMAAIGTPNNLLDTPECVRLWQTIQRMGRVPQACG